eukprot:scaffold95658_cov20-Tisochrysis_lutea.AAC.2
MKISARKEFELALKPPAATPVHKLGINGGINPPAAMNLLHRGARPLAQTVRACPGPGCTPAAHEQPRLATNSAAAALAGG